MVWAASLISLLGGCSQQLQRYEYTHPQMGTRFRLVLYASDDTVASEAAGAAFARVDQLNARLSDYLHGSELNRLSASSGTGAVVPVSADLYRVIETAQNISRRSDGAFDITVGPVVRLWRQARRARRLPDDHRIEKALRSVGYQHIQRHPDTRSITLRQPDMRLDLGGIAKGYAAHEMIKTLEERGVNRALIDAGGDLMLAGPPPNRETWRVALMPVPRKGSGVRVQGSEKPKPRAEAELVEAEAPDKSKPTPYVRATDVAVATSGDAFQHVDIAGVRYSHIVDPRTGIGMTTQTAATVIHPDGAIADALASACCVLEPDKALQLIDNTPGAAAMIVVNDGGELRTYRSARLADYLE